MGRFYTTRPFVVYGDDVSGHGPGAMPTAVRVGMRCAGGCAAPASSLADRPPVGLTGRLTPAGLTAGVCHRYVPAGRAGVSPRRSIRVPLLQAV